MLRSEGETRGQGTRRHGDAGTGRHEDAEARNEFGDVER
jgi:hypothetical protein